MSGFNTQETRDRLKKNALGIGEHTRSCVLITINHDGTLSSTHSFQGLADLTFMSSMLHKTMMDELNRHTQGT